MSEATDAVAGGVRIPRRELMATIEKHETTIAKYETRLRDVVRAYKGVVKEKDALEVMNPGYFGYSRMFTYMLITMLRISSGQLKGPQGRGRGQARR